MIAAGYGSAQKSHDGRLLETASALVRGERAAQFGHPDER